MKRVLFVCWGNICRSPAAEGVLTRLAGTRGLTDEVESDSAGTIAYHQGEPADARMRATASARGYELTSRSRPVVPEDFDRFDLVVAMDHKNLHDLEAMEIRGSAEVRLFSDFLSPGSPADVPDPYYGGAQGFDHVLDLLEEGCPRLLEHLVGPAG